MISSLERQIVEAIDDHDDERALRIYGELLEKQGLVADGMADAAARRSPGARAKSLVLTGEFWFGVLAASLTLAICGSIAQFAAGWF